MEPDSRSKAIPAVVPVTRKDALLSDFAEGMLRPQRYRPPKGNWSTGEALFGPAAYPYNEKAPNIVVQLE